MYSEINTMSSLWIFVFLSIGVAEAVDSNCRYGYGAYHVCDSSGGSSAHSWSSWTGPSWNSWTACDRSCGGGTRIRTASGYSPKKESCNELCYNGGTFASGGCKCPSWTYGPCCQNCTAIAYCHDLHCSNALNEKCEHCFDDNVFYKTTQSRTRCERMCSFDDNKCWPGSCSDGLTTGCKCAPGFLSSGAKCLLEHTTKPDIVSCQTIIYGGIAKTGDKRRTPGGTKCVDLQDFYGKFQPTMLEFSMTSELTINTPDPEKTRYISESKFGVTDTTVYIKQKPLTGAEKILSTHKRKEDTGKSEKVNSTVSSANIEVSLSQSKYHLNNGERLCIHYEAKGGGYVKGYNFRSNTILPAIPYDKTVTSKAICYRYDDAPPQHCSVNKTCTMSRTEPIQFQSRIIRYPTLQVDLDGWFDPIPKGGTTEHSSGIETYTITVNEVSGGVVSTSKVSDVTLNSTQISTSLNLSSSDGQPRLYCLRLEVKDVADNLKQARRFVLFDETTNITTDNGHTFLVTSASVDTNYQWQTHHNDVCLDWKDYFYNAFYKANDFFRDIKPHAEISGIYEQETGPLPVKGTPNVYGITTFSFSWAVGNRSVSPEMDVPNFLRQKYCHSLSLKDGETYVFNIKSTDIANNTFVENRTVHIDRSAPHINNLGLEKYGLRRLFAHGNTDLAKMDISFEVLDPHSGILNVEWTFGTAETQGVLGQGMVTAKTINGMHGDQCPDNVTDCYCPDVGLCEVSKYSISLNKLVNNRTNVGTHNRNYYFTIKVTNNAKLVNIEHLDILVDDSPPETGVIFEGISGNPDIDYTSEEEFMVNWHGFIDHESGIKEYRLRIEDHCLDKSDLFQDENEDLDERNTVVPYTETSVRLVANFTGKKFTSIIAINNAMEPSDVVCSDGITRDDTPPKVTNLRIQIGRWSESIYCKGGSAWLLQSNLKKTPLSMPPACHKLCMSDSPMSDMIDALQEETSSTNNDTDTSEFMCMTFQLYSQQNTIFLPNDHVYIQWDNIEQGSQIDEIYVGFGTGRTNTSLMSIMDYKSTHMQKYFKVNHLGVGSGVIFYAFIRTVNKAKLEHVTVVGPILIDETPPYARTKPIVKIDVDHVIIGWENDTFYDLEQTGVIDQILFELVREEVVVSPLLEWRSHDSTKCLGFSGGCFKYPLKRLQKMDSDLGLNFSVNVHAYNNAGHFTKVSTDTFKLPSLYPPGQAIVSDIDPELRDDPLSWTDVDLHFTSNTLCASWQGLKHHEKLNLEIGVGTNQSTADVVAFHTSNRTRVDCITADTIKPHSKYFFLIRAVCSGGETHSSSNGVEINNETKVIDSIDISLEHESNTLDSFEVEEYTVSKSQLCLHDTILIGQVYTATITNTTTNSTINSQDVIIKHQKFNASSSTIISEFIPVTERPCFQIDGGNVSFEISKQERDHSEKTYISNSGAIYARWEVMNSNISNKISFKIGLFEIGSANTSYSDTEVVPMEKTKGYLWHEFEHIPSHSDVEYVIAIQPCTNTRCLHGFSKSQTFEIEYKIQDYDILDPKIISKDVGCSKVSMTWQQFQAKSGISMYVWSISKDKAANSILSTWRPVVPTTQQTYQVNECIDLPISGRATLFICVRGFSMAGNVIINCQQAVTETQDDSMKEKLYDIDTRRDTWNTIKQMIHSSNIGGKYTLLHDSELDFGTSKLSIGGVLLYSTERNVTWYLMKSSRLPRYSQCEHDKHCIHSTTNTNGYVIFEKTLIRYNTFYYICAYSSVTYIEREQFIETQDELQSCSNGFVIDDTPPIKGTVTVQNHNGYVTDMNNIAITWNGFSDNIKAETLGYHSPIKYYSIAIGTRADGEDLKNFTVVGDTNSIRERLTNILDGTMLFVSIKATDQAGLTSVVSSEGLVVDTSPPLPPTMTINGRRHGRIYIMKSTCTVHVGRNEDQQSGIGYTKLSIGTSKGQSDMSFKRFVERQMELSLPNDLQDGHAYYVTAKVTNRAGLTSGAVSLKIIMDRSPPTGGHVMDGHLANEKDINFQRDLNSVSAHWKGFDDPHSGIYKYRVALGTRPFLDDTRQFMDVGILTEYAWNGTFKLGQKYYTTVEACNGAGLCLARSSNGVLLDNSPPVAGIVKVGTGSNHVKYLPNGGSVHIQWMGFDDPQSGIDHYETCVGTSPYQCDIQSFTTCLIQSHIIRTNLNLKLGISYFASVKALNKVGFEVTSTSDEFKIDDTPPIIVRKPSFILDGYSLKKDKYQHEKSILRVSWQFEDYESHVANHIVSLKTHHEGHTPVEDIHVGDVRELTINLDKNNWLNNGDTYFATVSSCNVAGLCTSARSENLLIDSTPPHQGGFKPPMHWKNYIDTHGQDKCNITLTWYGFLDAESSINNYYLTVSRNYSGQELSNGIFITKAVPVETEQKATIIIEQQLKPDDELILTVWAQNAAGLDSSVARITVYALPIVKGSLANMHGVLEIQKHSCDVHFCNGDCTCAVIGKPCVGTSMKTNCEPMNTLELMNSSFPAFSVFAGLSDHHQTTSASSACLSGHWNTSGNEQLVHRYEWSMGLKDQPIGEGVFDLKVEIRWNDVGKLNQAVYCLPKNFGLENDKDYVVYVKAWYAADVYTVFNSLPIHIDHKPPHINKGKTVKDSDASCSKDYDVIDWMDTITACWNGVFSEPHGKITHYSLSLGSTINGSDIFPRKDIWLATSYTFKSLSLSHGTKYYFTVTAYNNVGLHTTLSSDGFVVDMDTPIRGVVFNTDRYTDSTFQTSTSTFSISWHGFTDHHSGIQSYLVAVVEDMIDDYTNVSFVNVNLKTSHIVRGVTLQHGNSYVGLVKSIDAAGHVSNIARSNPKTIDVTPPYVSTCSEQSELYSNTYSLDDFISILLNVTKNKYYVIKGFVFGNHSIFEPTLSIGKFQMIAPITENDNASIEFQHYYLSLKSDEINVSVSFADNEPISLNASLYLSVSECNPSSSSDNTSNAVEVRQIGLSKLSVRCPLVDIESSVAKVEIGVGTTPNGYQLRPLSSFSTSGVIETDLVHSSHIYVTVVAYNHANLKSVFKSSHLLVDKTPPVLKDVQMVLTPVNVSTNVVDIDVKWDADDAESGIKYCLCGLGSAEHMTDLIKYTMSSNVTSCHFLNTQRQHGDRVYASIKCINNIELASIPMIKVLTIVLDKPQTINARLNVLSNGAMSMHGSSSPGIGPQIAVWFVQTDANSIKLEWSEFTDSTNIDHYKYRLTWQNESISDWTKCSKTATEVSGIDMLNGRRYTAEVRAVNVGLYTSDSVYTDIVLHNVEPGLTGHPVVIENVGHQMKLDWSEVFSLAIDLGVTFDVVIGSRPGFTDIIELNRVDFNKYAFDMPRSTIVTQDITEMFLSVTCTYSTGLHNVYKTNFKF